MAGYFLPAILFCPIWYLPFGGRLAQLGERLVYTQ